MFPSLWPVRSITLAMGRRHESWANNFTSGNIWHTHRCKPHLTEYWNMRLGKFMHINGSLLNQSEPVLPEVSQIKFGIDDNSRFARWVRSKLELVRQHEV